VGFGRNDCSSGKTTWISAFAKGVKSKKGMKSMKGEKGREKDTERKTPEQILYQLKGEVVEGFFAENPVKIFPDDFLARKVKKELEYMPPLPEL